MKADTMTPMRRGDDLAAAALYPPVLAAERPAGLEPVLSVRSTRPAACSTRPRLRCSLAGLLLWMLLRLLLLGLQLLSRGPSHLPGLEVTHREKHDP